MMSRDFARIATVGVAAAFTFAVLPVSILAFFVLLAQDNPASESDVKGLRNVALFILGLGALIGLAIAIAGLGNFGSAVFGLSVPLLLMLTVSILQKGGITGNAIAAMVVMSFVGAATGSIAGFVNRKFDRGLVKNQNEKTHRMRP
jgi:hypothetical protein